MEVNSELLNGSFATDIDEILQDERHTGSSTDDAWHSDVITRVVVLYLGVVNRIGRCGRKTPQRPS